MNERNNDSEDHSGQSAPGSLPKQLLALLAEHGYRGRIVEAGRLEDLNKGIEKQRASGALDSEVERKHMHGFDYDFTREHPEARAIIVVAAPQPHLRLSFQHRDQKVPVVIPPTYSNRIDSRVEELLQVILSPAGYKLFRRPLPLKLLAVHSGLAQYGKNNIAYVQGMGSYCRLMAFYTDMPLDDADWFDLRYMDACDKCTACLKKCPTGAIVADRFVIHAERCLTYYNEWETDFPSDLDPAVHHCLIGCLYCQAFCPVNHDVPIEVEDGPSLDSDETETLVRGASEAAMPSSVVDKLEEFGFLEDLPEITRNLRLLLEVPGNIERGLNFITGGLIRGDGNDSR